MKKSLLLLLLVAFITLLTSCSKQELKEITITEASAMLQEAKDNTTSVDAYSFGMPLKVTYIDKATFNDELKKEEKYDIKGTIKATVNNKKKRHTLNLILIILLVILVLAQPLLLPF